MHANIRFSSQSARAYTHTHTFVYVPVQLGFRYIYVFSRVTRRSSRERTFSSRSKKYMFFLKKKLLWKKNFLSNCVIFSFTPFCPLATPSSCSLTLSLSLSLSHSLSLTVCLLFFLSSSASPLPSPRSCPMRPLTSPLFLRPSAATFDRSAAYPHLQDLPLLPSAP